MEKPRLLVIVRHAKAEPSAPSDAERPLAARGLTDAADAGRWLDAAGFAPDAALVSSAVRALQTWEQMTEAAGWQVQAQLEPGLYSADPEAALDILRLADDAARTVLVVGHNPTMWTLAQLLDDGEGDPEATTGLLRGFPTSAVAVLEHDGAWADLGSGTARVVAFHAPERAH